MKRSESVNPLSQLVGSARWLLCWIVIVSGMVGCFIMTMVGSVHAAEADIALVGPPVLVKDINTRTGDTYAGFIKAGDHLLIKESVASGKPRLWWSDGTPAGTVVLGQVELLGGPQRLNGFWYFMGTDSQQGAALWRTDGTAAGTQRIQALRTDGGSEVYGYEANFVLAHELLFFAGYNQAAEPVLWKSDGTPAGTTVLKTFPGAMWRDPALVKLDDTLYFTLYTDFVTNGAGITVAQKTLWQSDGSAAHTTLVKALPVVDEVFGYHARPIPVQHKLFYPVDSTLWQSDGSAAGTIRVGEYISTTVPCGSLGCGVDIAPGIRQLTAVNDLLFFEAQVALSEWRLLRSDGTAAGTAPVMDLDPLLLLGEYKQALLFTRDDGTLWITDSAGTTASALLGDQARLFIDANANPMPVIANGRAYFVARAMATDEIELWSTDGTVAGTVRVKTIGHRAEYGNLELTSIDNTLLLMAAVEDAGVQLWRSDGTAAGTTLVATFASYGYSFELTSIGRTAVFVADDGEHGLEPWVSDGTAAGTRLLHDFNLAPGNAYPKEFTTVNDRLLFVADDNAGTKLWQSDGSSANTTVIVAPQDGLEDSLTSLTYTRYPVNDTVFIALYAYRVNQGYTTALWAGDANLTNFRTLQTFGPEQYEVHIDFADLDNRLYFTTGKSADMPGFFTPGFYQSDGTPAGTVLVKTLPGNPLSAIVKRNGNLYFLTFAGLGNATMQLWQSDGTAAGTVAVATIDSLFKLAIAVHDGALLFLGENFQGGTELWRSDGTQAGTTLLKTLAGTYDPHHKPIFYQLDERLLFIVKNAADAFELWSSDGTTAGTLLAHTFSATTDPTLPIPVVVNSDNLFFAADDGDHGAELWLSDGTAAGTRLVKDMAEGTPLAYPSGLQPVSDILVFAATDAQGRQALWRTNSTGTRTQKLFDLGGLSEPTEFALASNHLFFNASSPAVGRELWAVAVSPTTVLTATMPAQIIGDGVGPHTVAITLSNQGMTKATDVLLTVTLNDGVTYVGNSSNAAAARNGNTVTLNLGTIGLWYTTTVELYLRLPPTATAERSYGVPYTISTANVTTLSGETALQLAAHARYLPLIAR